jgi:hypothetical protein
MALCTAPGRADTASTRTVIGSVGEVSVFVGLVDQAHEAHCSNIVSAMVCTVPEGPMAGLHLATCSICGSGKSTRSRSAPHGWLPRDILDDDPELFDRVMMTSALTDRSAGVRRAGRRGS